MLSVLVKLLVLIKPSVLIELLVLIKINTN
jgi:hypothetical protein